MECYLSLAWAESAGCNIILDLTYPQTGSRSGWGSSYRCDVKNKPHILQSKPCHKCAWLFALQIINYVTYMPNKVYITKNPWPALRNQNSIHFYNFYTNFCSLPSSLPVDNTWHEFVDEVHIIWLSEVSFLFPMHLRIIIPWALPHLVVRHPCCKDHMRWTPSQRPVPCDQPHS